MIAGRRDATGQNEMRDSWRLSDRGGMDALPAAKSRGRKVPILPCRGKLLQPARLRRFLVKKRKRSWRVAPSSHHDLYPETDQLVADPSSRLFALMASALRDVRLELNRPVLASVTCDIAAARQRLASARNEARRMISQSSASHRRSLSTFVVKQL